MKSEYIIVIPPYYSGTSFEDIKESLSVAVKKSGIDIEFLGCIDPIENSISSNSLLDDSNYIAGQFEILNHLIARRHTLKKILFLDFFNPGLDLFKYSLVQEDLDVHMGSLLHGGSFVPGDLYNYGWIKGFETGWFDLNDKVYVPSEYSGNTCPRSLKEKIRVFAWGMDSFTPKSSVTKKWDIVFPHRLQVDKGIDQLLDIMRLLPDAGFLIPSPLKREDFSKNIFYDRINGLPNVKIVYDVDNEKFLNYLSESRIVLSCAIQETFGYSVMKSILCGCYPVLPDRACYPEFFDKKYLYKSQEEAAELIRKVLSGQRDERSDLSAAQERISKFSFLPIIEDFFK